MGSLTAKVCPAVPSDATLTTWAGRIPPSRLYRLLGGTDHGAEHELEDRLFTEGVGNDLQAPAFFDEQTLEKVRGSDFPAVRNGYWTPKLTENLVPKRGFEPRTY